jgi:hypothetical protein
MLWIASLVCLVALPSIGVPRIQLRLLAPIAFWPSKENKMNVATTQHRNGQKAKMNLHILTLFTHWNRRHTASHHETKRRQKYVTSSLLFFVILVEIDFYAHADKIFHTSKPTSSAHPLGMWNGRKQTTKVRVGRESIVPKFLKQVGTYTPQ